MKKFFVSALTAVILMGFGVFTDTNQLEQENSHYREYGFQYCNNDNDGKYCGRYGCGQGQGNNNG